MAALFTMKALQIINPYSGHITGQIKGLRMEAFVDRHLLRSLFVLGSGEGEGHSSEVIT